MGCLVQKILRSDNGTEDAFRSSSDYSLKIPKEMLVYFTLNIPFSVIKWETEFLANKLYAVFIHSSECHKQKEQTSMCKCVHRGSLKFHPW